MRPLSLIYITSNAFQAFLTRQDQESVLACVKRHLLPDGIFAFETRNPSGHDLNSTEYEEYWQTYTSVQGNRVSISGTQRYEPLAQVLHWTSYRRWSDGEGDHTKITRIACRFTYPQELESLLHYNGFQILQQYGNWNKEPLTASSPSIITICKRDKQ